MSVLIPLVYSLFSHLKTAFSITLLHIKGRISLGKLDVEYSNETVLCFIWNAIHSPVWNNNLNFTYTVKFKLLKNQLFRNYRKLKFILEGERNTSRYKS